VKTTIALLALALSAFADDWPMHRGTPALTGRATSPAPAKPALKWTFKAGKPVVGGAAIAGDRVFFGDNSGVIRAVSLTDGKELWKFATESAVEAVPLILDGVCYVGAADGRLYALDAADGKKKWAPFETGDKILASASWAKDPASEKKWVLVGSYDFSFYAVDAATGKQVWKVETENFINSTPAITADGLALFGGCDALVHVVSLKEQKEIRTLDAEAYVGASAAVDGRMAYFGSDSKKVYAFDVHHEKPVWTYRDRNFAYFSSPALSADLVMIGARDKRVHALDRKTGEARWTFATKGDVDSSPVLCSDGALVFGSLDGRLYCIESTTGKERWRYEIGSDVAASPAVSRGLIVIGANDGNVYCIGNE
jgi:eukaryotic-like serine/threonine-protein kinase